MSNNRLQCRNSGVSGGSVCPCPPTDALQPVNWSSYAAVSTTMSIPSQQIIWHLIPTRVAVHDKTDGLLCRFTAMLDKGRAPGAI